MAGKGITYVDKETGELHTGNNRFYQFYEHNIKLLRWLAKENQCAFQIFMFIIENMDGRNALVISQYAIAEAVGIHRVTAHKAVKFLMENKCLGAYKAGNTNVYAVNADIVWRDTHDNKKYAKFDARVYLSKNEQDLDQAPIKTEVIGHAISRQKTIFDKEQKKQSRTKE